MADNGLFETHVRLLIEYQVDRYIHINNLLAYEEEKHLPIYRLVETYCLAPRLEVEIWVPILSLDSELKDFEIAPEVEVLEMSKEFQFARAPKQQFNWGEHPWVQASAKYALRLPNYSIPNDDWLTVSRIVSTAEAYPLKRINAFFAALRAATRVETGYAQLFMLPVRWAHGFTEKVLPLYGTTVRDYPQKFEDGYWNRDQFPVLNPEQWETVSRIFAFLDKHTSDKENRRLGLALNRLNQSYLRAEDDDAVLDATIALESLLSDGNEEMTHKLATRIAALSKLADEKQDSYSVFQNVKKVYGFRSAVAHGDVDKIEKRRVMPNGTSTASVSRELLSLVLLALSRHEKYLEVQKIDRELLLGSTAPSESTSEN
jgi:hypothetical protein